MNLYWVTVYACPGSDYVNGGAALVSAETPEQAVALVEATDDMTVQYRHFDQFHQRLPVPVPDVSLVPRGLPVASVLFSETVTE